MVNTLSLTDNALTTLQTFKSEINITDTSKDALLEMYINAGSDIIENYCNRKFQKQQHTEIIDGTGSKTICLKNYPITSVSSIQVDGEEVNTSDYQVAIDTGEVYHSTGWTQGEKNIKVTYLGGYTLPKDATEQEPSNLPPSLEMACILLSEILYSCTIDKSYERIGEYSVEYTEPFKDMENHMPLIVETFLVPHKRG